jgi:hypothetical protein
LTFAFSNELGSAAAAARSYLAVESSGAEPSLPLNQATYSVGRKISVRILATSKPSMIAKAIGPQNTVGAIGIMPNTGRHSR